MWEEDIQAIFPSNKHDDDDYILPPLHYHCVLGLPTEEEASNVLLPDDDGVALRRQLRMMVVMGLAASCDNIAATFEMLLRFSRLTLIFAAVSDFGCSTEECSTMRLHAGGVTFVHCYSCSSYCFFSRVFSYYLALLTGMEI